MSAAVRLWERRYVLNRAWWPLVVLAAGVVVALAPTDLSLALVGGSALAIAALVRPEWGVYALVFAVPFGSVRQVHVANFSLNVSEVCVGLVVAGWLAQMVVRRQVVVPRAPLLGPLIIWLSVLTLTWLTAVSLSASLKETAKWVEVTLLYLFVASRFDEKTVRRTVVLILLAGVAEAVLGMAQFFGRIGPDGFLWSTPVGLFMRAFGTFEQPNPYAGYLGLVAPLAYGLWLVHGAGRGSGSGPGLWRWMTRATLYAGVAVLLAVAMLMSWSRGAMIGFAAAFVVMNVVRSRRAAAIFLASAFVLAALGAVQMLPSAITQRFVDFLPFLSIPDVSRVEVNPINFAIVQRLAHWTAAWRMFVDHPWLGVGIGNYGVAYAQYMVPPWTDALGHAHNYYLNVAAEAGLTGLAAYLILWVAAIWQALKALRRTSGFARGVALGVLGVLVQLSTHNFVDNLWVHNMYLHVAILLGCLAAVTPDITKSDELQHV